MLPLSAIDSISPAWNHTRNLLWTPRNWRLLLKVGCVAVLAQMAGFNLSGGNRMGGPINHGHHVLPPAAMAAIIASVVVIAIVAFLIWAVIFYVGSRMQFVLFEIVLRRDTTVGPIWQRYGAATWRWIGLKLAYFLVALLAMAPLLVPMAIHLYRTLPNLNTGHPAQLFAFAAGMFGFGVTFFLLSLFLGAAYRLLLSFGLPSMALESTSLRETIRRIVTLIQSEPTEVFLYLLMNIVLGAAGGLAGGIAWFLGSMVLAVPMGGIGALLWFALHAGGVGAHVVMIGGWVAMGIVMLVAMIAGGVMLFGYLYAFLQAYALYFLGGRYPRVGAYLAPLLATPPPPSYVPAPGYMAPPLA